MKNKVLFSGQTDTHQTKCSNWISKEVVKYLS